MSVSHTAIAKTLRECGSNDYRESSGMFYIEYRGDGAAITPELSQSVLEEHNAVVSKVNRVSDTETRIVFEELQKDTVVTRVEEEINTI